MHHGYNYFVLTTLYQSHLTMKVLGSIYVQTPHYQPRTISHPQYAIAQHEQAYWGSSRSSFLKFSQSQLTSEIPPNKEIELMEIPSILKADSPEEDIATLYCDSSETVSLGNHSPTVR